VPAGFLMSPPQSLEATAAVDARAEPETLDHSRREDALDFKRQPHEFYWRKSNARLGPSAFSGIAPFNAAWHYAASRSSPVHCKSWSMP
jgi:hypothetical protein